VSLPAQRKAGRLEGHSDTSVTTAGDSSFTTPLQLQKPCGMRLRMNTRRFLRSYEGTATAKNGYEHAWMNIMSKNMRRRRA